MTRYHLFGLTISAAITACVLAATPKGTPVGPGGLSGGPSAVSYPNTPAEGLQTLPEGSQASLPPLRYANGLDTAH